MSRPSFIGNYLDFIEEDNSHYPDSDEMLAIGSAVGKKLGLKRIGIHIETLLPGRRTSFPHAESDEEEFGFVIEGAPDVWIDGQLHRLGPGDFVAFPAGTGICHTFINNSNFTVRLLVGGEATKKSNKILYALHAERNEARKLKEDFWHDHPPLNLGPHDGLSDLKRQGKVIQTWNHVRIETENLVLRGYVPTDAPAIFKFGKEDHITAYIPWGPFKTLEEVHDHIKKRNNNCLETPDLAIAFKHKPDVVIGGVCAFWANKRNHVLEVGAVLDDDHWGTGVIKEALSALINFCWENFEVNRIQAMAQTENKNSVNFLRKFGFQHEGTIRSAVWADGKTLDLEMFSVLRES